MIASGIKSVQIACETDSIRSVLEIIADTDLITTIPKATTQPHLENFLVFLDFDPPQFRWPPGGIRRTDTSESQAEHRFLQMLSIVL